MTCRLNAKYALLITHFSFTIITRLPQWFMKFILLYHKKKKKGGSQLNEMYLVDSGRCFAYIKSRYLIPFAAHPFELNWFRCCSFLPFDFRSILSIHLLSFSLLLTLTIRNNNKHKSRNARQINLPAACAR